MKKKFKKLTTDFPTIKEMEWDINNLKASKEVFEYLTDAFWLHDDLEASITNSDIKTTHAISSVLFAFEHMDELIDSRISVVKSMIQQNMQLNKKEQLLKENENENSILN